MDRILLVTRNQSKHPDRGCAKASHDGRISGRGEFNRASPKKMCEKFWTLSAKASHDGRISGRGELDRASLQKNVRKILDVILPKEGRDGATWNMQHLAHGGNLFVARGGLLAGFL